MRIVQGDQVQPQPAVRYRPGSLTACILLEGTPGTPGNFQLSLGITGADFLSPRHRHNFEQYRCVLQGGFDFARDGKMQPGMVGYFPEGVYYGPQSSAEDTVAAVLQFGGVSRNGYLGAAEVNAGMAALQQHGVFEKGIYRRTGPDTGHRSQDGFEAIWEHVNRRPDRFSGLAALPMHDPDEAARELERCVKDFGFRGALVNGFSQVGDADTVAYYDQPQYRPFWAMLERLDVPFYLHPRNPVPRDAKIYDGHGWLMGPIWALPIQPSTLE